ncbi:hypothetical protein AC579_4283 [Pseudocercospora musae]|uniref:Uncharacterized protein n=1 Tax=Pseudocercospora musae TaxID=113226 RepID=A0A139IAR8_9PEZI|nr:hypothetical protein AC579_4283 [Pseudocercospora musae]
MSSRSQSESSDIWITNRDIRYLLSSIASDSDRELSDSSFGNQPRRPPMATRPSQFGNDVRNSESVVMDRELRREQIAAIFDSETIADERRHLLQFIRQWNINVPEWQGEEPWPFGSDPNENAVQALARQRQQFAAQDNDIRVSASEVIEMHEPTVEAPPPDPDTDSSVESEPPADVDELHAAEDTSSEIGSTYPRPSPLAIDPNTGAVDEDHFANETAPYVILLGRIQDFAAGRPEQDESIIRDFAYNIASQIWGDNGPDVARSIMARWRPYIEQPNPRDEALLDEQWDQILALEAEANKWKSLRNAAGLLFHMAYLEWERESNNDAKDFAEHWRNAMKVTTNDAYIASILTWFPAVPDDVKSPLARLSRCHHKLLALNYSIETLRWTAMEPHGNTEAAIARWTQYQESEAFHLGKQLHGGKGRFGYESRSAFRDSCTCNCIACIPLSARFNNADDPAQYVDIEASLRIREVRMWLAEEECGAKGASSAVLHDHRFAIQCAMRWAWKVRTVLDTHVEHISSEPERNSPQYNVLAEHGDSSVLYTRRFVVLLLGYIHPPALLVAGGQTHSGASLESPTPFAISGAFQTPMLARIMTGCTRPPPSRMHDTDIPAHNAGGAESMPSE